MKLNLLQIIVLIVILAGIAYGTYSATVDQLPDYTGTVIGNTTSTDNSTGNPVIGTLYVHTNNKNTDNMTIIIKKNTKIYQETSNGTQVEKDISIIKNGQTIDIYTVGDPTNTLPPQINSEKIIVKNKSK